MVHLEKNSNKSFSSDFCDLGDDDQARLRRPSPTPSRQRHQQQGRHKSPTNRSSSNPIKKCESFTSNQKM